MRPGPWRLAVAGLVLLAATSQAQEGPAPLLTLDQDRFFVESDFGRAAVERERGETAALEQENKRIEAELVAEEQALTDQRGSLSPEEFTERATAFDEKVERIRAEQDAKAQALVARRDAERKEFLQLAGPILGELLGERKATAILEKGLVIVALSAIDITDEAIAKLNATLAKPPTDLPVERPAGPPIDAPTDPPAGP
ncbi:OmpH family outer membrane protein [Tabrizicola sp.]|uniref:OmpH family outer membrane protein n=1 Tax=Tabrizicola sp. TaxID=2005166 RepID=UPI0027362C00|nr:OmpH family outer membrane protein [Tabrizicola sp.]MDP3196444.1 OmpH family outer membrane protein [Tabrizicola sp.]